MNEIIFYNRSNKWLVVFGEYCGENVCTGCCVLMRDSFGDKKKREEKEEDEKYTN